MDYFKRPGISNSRLSIFEQSPLHYKHSLDNPKPETPAMLIGSATHTILFEREMLATSFFIVDYSKKPFPDSNMAKKENKLWLSDQHAMNEGKNEVSLEDYDMMMFMQQELFKHDMAREIIEGALYEQERYWKDLVFGMDCKSKIDIYRKGILKADYKTTISADPWQFHKDAWKRKYYRQGAFYTDCDGENTPFYFIAQEKTAPYAISVHRCTEDLINYGRNEYTKLIGQLKACIESDLWPGYEIKNDIDHDWFDFDIPEWKRQLM
jgi:hypothetical protein